MPFVAPDRLVADGDAVIPKFLGQLPQAQTFLYKLLGPSNNESMKRTDFTDSSHLDTALLRLAAGQRRKSRRDLPTPSFSEVDKMQKVEDQLPQSLLGLSLERVLCTSYNTRETRGLDP